MFRSIYKVLKFDFGNWLFHYHHFFSILVLPLNEIYNFINPIYKKEKILISEVNAKILIENSNNDIRNTLNNLQLYDK